MRRVIWVVAGLVLLSGSLWLYRLHGNREPASITTTPGIQEPSTGWNLYVDPNFGFTFSYPATWMIEAPARMAVPTIPEYGYHIVIRNSDDVAAKGNLRPRDIKIEVWLFPRPANYMTLEEWAGRRALFAPGTSYGPMKKSMIGPQDAIQWTVVGPTVPGGAQLVAVDRPHGILLFVAHPANSLHLSSFETMVRSLK